MSAGRAVFRLRFFGPVRDRAGCEHAFVEVALPATVGAVVAAAREALPGLSDLEALRVRFAVNEEYADPSRALRPGDVVSLIPPVGGG